jgi:hypothetical protein
MAITQPVQDMFLEKLIRTALINRIREMVDEEMQEVQQRIAGQVEKIVAQCAVEVTNHITMERYGGELVIRVHFDQSKEK